MAEYVRLVTTLVPQWRGTQPTHTSEVNNQEAGGGKGGGGVGPAVSTLMNNSEVIPDENKSVFDWCKEGNEARLLTMVTTTNVNQLDEQVGT